MNLDVSRIPNLEFFYAIDFLDVEGLLEVPKPILDDSCTVTMTPEARIIQWRVSIIIIHITHRIWTKGRERETGCLRIRALDLSLSYPCRLKAAGILADNRR